MEKYHVISLFIGLVSVVVITVKGNRKYQRPLLWFGFIPVFIIVHSIIGYSYFSMAVDNFYNIGPEPNIIYQIFSITYIGIVFFGLPLELIGLPDNIAYLTAFILNSLMVAILIVLLYQRLKSN